MPEGISTLPPGDGGRWREEFRTLTHDLDMRAQLSLGGSTVDGRVLDLSPGGLGIAVPPNMASAILSNSANLTVWQGDQPVPLGEAEIRHSDPVNDHVVIGVQVSDNVRPALDALLAHCNNGGESALATNEEPDSLSPAETAAVERGLDLREGFGFRCEWIVSPDSLQPFAGEILSTGLERDGVFITLPRLLHFLNQHPELLALFTENVLLPVMCQRGGVLNGSSVHFSLHGNFPEWWLLKSNALEILQRTARDHHCPLGRLAVELLETQTVPPERRGELLSVLKQLSDWGVQSFFDDIEPEDVAPRLVAMGELQVLRAKTSARQLWQFVAHDPCPNDNFSKLSATLQNLGKPVKLIVEGCELPLGRTGSILHKLLEPFPYVQVIGFQGRSVDSQDER